MAANTTKTKKKVGKAPVAAPQPGFKRKKKVVKESLAQRLCDHICEGGDEEEEEDKGPSCPNCGGEGVSMGGLGNREYFRCRDCGSEYSQQKEKKE